MSAPVSKKRKFVADGIFYAELNEFFMRELFEEGYSGVEILTNPNRISIVIKATKIKMVVGEKARRIRELTSVVQKRFKFPEGAIELFAERLPTRALCAVAQAESLRYKLLSGMAVRRACYGVVRFIMDCQAKGCEVTVSGKIRGQRAKAMKFRDGYMIKSGQPSQDFVDEAVRHCLLRQGVLGVRVAIMLPSDPTGKNGVARALPDHVITKSEEEVLAPKKAFAHSD